MKLIILLLLILFSVLGVNKEAYASTFKFSWMNTVVRIPVGDELSKYIDTPQARLYRDEVLLADANITYAPQGDWLYFLKDVDTRRVGSYQVWYKAFENDKYRPGTCQGYKCLITFLVYDNIAPTLSIHNDNIYRDRGYMHGATREEIDKDLMTNITATDNYKGEIKISLSHQLSYDIVGKYEILVTAVDKSGNIKKGSFNVTVGERNLPTITFLGNDNTLKIGLNQSIDIQSFFEAYDHQYGDISNEIIFPIIDSSVVGKFKYKPYLIKDGLRAECEITIEIVDDVEPELVLTTHNIILSYKEDFSTIDFKRYVLGVNDNTPYNEEALSITYDLENMVGGYHIYYTYTDGIYVVSDTIDVTLISRERPIIEVSDVYIDNDTSLDLLGFINIIDESDPDIYKSLTIDDSRVDYSKPGSYFATAYCINSSGLSATKQFRVIVAGGSDSSALPLLYIIIGTISGLLVSVIGFIIFYFIYKKRHKPI